MAKNTTKIIYSDISPIISKEPRLAINIDAIMVSLNNLLTTEKGERLNLPQYGLSMDDYLWEIVDEDTAWALKNKLFYEITYWEPRVEMNIQKSTVIPLPEEKAFDVTLVFTVKNIPDSEFKLSGIIANLLTLGN
mgnify:CR=1 FL=1|jgi:phage baseplate assembly protein W